LTCNRDTTPTVLLAEWRASSDLFDGEVAAGPVPRLFAEDPDKAKQAIENEPLLAFKDLGKIYRKFFVPENITIRDAISLVKKPRYSISLNQKLIMKYIYIHKRK
jgi:hypothetical protein